jgi:hypothetical protein
MPALMGQWRANMDVQLTIDLGKIVQYMAKYVTKAESTITKGGEALMRRVIKDNLNNGSTVNTVLRKAMNKLMGEPMLQKQETCHQIAGLSDRPVLTYLRCSQRSEGFSPPCASSGGKQPPQW